MKIVQLMIAVVLISCNSERNGHNSSEIDLEKSVTTSGDSIVIEKRECDCSPINPLSSGPGSPTFHNHENFSGTKTRNDIELAKYGKESTRLKVTSLQLRDYDTIPDKFAVFENVERVMISTRSGVKGLDKFPKLKEITFFDSEVKVDTTEKWLKRIKIFNADKTRIIGLGSFRYMPNLVSLHMGFSGFDMWPKDIQNLECLQTLILGAHCFGEVNLSTIDLSNFKCLKKAIFSTWYNTLSGLPAGLDDTSKIIELEVSHEKLTRAEKSEIKKYKQLSKTLSK
jgi:hypothetical protein